MKRCVVISAAKIDNYDFLKSNIAKDDFVICADGGYRHALRIGRQPDLLVGDFDSMPEPDDVKCDVIKFPIEKDYSDTMLAVFEGMKRGCGEFLIFGGIGGRLDHTFANIQVLSYLLEKGVKAKLIDEKNTVFMIKNETINIKRIKGCKLSVFAWDNDLDVSISGVKYPLNKHRLGVSSSLGLSNEFEENEAHVIADGGSLLIFLTKD